VRVRATRGTERVTAQLAVDLDQPTLTFAVTADEYERPVDRASAPLDDMIAFANRPANAIELIDGRGQPPDWPMPTPLILDGVNRPGKKPNDFYAKVLFYKLVCERAGQSYAERIAADNGVVYRWVNEAKRRELEPSPGVIRWPGEPIRATQ
jgi:hypothetical protein